MDVSQVVQALHNPSYDPQRSGKDLSHRKVLTYKCGELLPVICEEVVPKDYFEVDLAALVRSTMPLNTAAFMRSKIHFDFFFVPMTAVWRNFDKFYSQRDDNYTSYAQGFAYEPNVTLKTIGDLILAGSTSSPVDSQESRSKLYDLLGYGNWKGVTAADFASGGQYANIASKSLTALPLMAYQRIYNMHYRDPWRDEPNSAYTLKSMSADYVDCSSYANSLISNTDSNSQLGAVRYHRYPMDLFMGLLPSQQFGTVSQIKLAQNTQFVLNGTNKTDYDTNSWQRSDGTSMGTANDIQTAGGGLVEIDGGYKGIRHNHSLGSTINVQSGASLFDVLELRRAIAAQKWAEYNVRAGWKASKQMRAMFGVGSELDVKHDVQFLDGYEFPIMVDEVVQSSGATASTNQLGELGGKVIGVGNGKTVKFSSGNRFGYFMCISYILPQVEYNANGIDKQLVRSVPADHYQPMFANLGLEPVFKFELNAKGNTAVFDYTLGFTTRYHEYKTRQDKVYADFITQNGVSLNSWVTVRRDLESIVNSGTIPASYLYVNPSILDTLFAQNADSLLDTDQFMANLNFSMKAVRPMSDLGLPTM